MGILQPFPQFRGGNLEGYQSRDPECLTWGPAGTGKSLMSMFKLCHLAMVFPKTRWFLVRKTKASLTESALVTLERDVIGESSPVLTKRPMMRKTRDFYEFPNGSVIVTAGLDRPEKLFSTEYNGGYVQEATELEQDEWQSLKRALRAPYRTAYRLSDGRIPQPFYQIWADCNPTYQHHWLKKRMDLGTLKGYRSTHKDNPRFWNGTDWTQDGKDYIETQLGTLTGFMRQRLLDGIWASAEGLVYEEWRDDVHILPPSFTVPATWDRYWSIDWGFTDPLCLQFWAMDGDKRLYLYRELYQTGRVVEDVAKWCKEELATKREPRPKAIVCDHDPENKATFERHCPGLMLTLADKLNKRGGVQMVKSRLKVQADGRPRLFVLPGALTHPADRILQQKGLPTKFSEEIVGYSWNPDKDEPQDGNDHSMDAMLYMVRHADMNAQTWYFK